MPFGISRRPIFTVPPSARPSSKSRAHANPLTSASDILIATCNRPAHLLLALQSLEEQTLPPAPGSVVICDASDFPQADSIARHHPLRPRVLRATARGAAAQRNQALAVTRSPDVIFLDDDVLLQPDCLEHLGRASQARPDAGAITATNINEAYHPPGALTLKLLRWIERGRSRPTYAGTCVGPAWTFLPADHPKQPAIVELEWAATTCVLYRRHLLPEPAFLPRFQGASLGEDLALSLTVRQAAPILQATRARFHHFNAPGDHKKSRAATARMTLVNRHFIVSQILKRGDSRAGLELAVMLLSGWLGQLRSPRKWPAAAALLTGYVLGFLDLLRSAPDNASNSQTHPA